MIFITTEEEIKYGKNLISLYFYTFWMPGHKKMITMLEKMENKYKNISFFAVEADYYKSLCRKFNIQFVPTIIAINNNKEIGRINGMVLTSALKHQFSEIYNNYKGEGL